MKVAYVFWIAPLVVATVFALGNSANCDETKLPLDKLPTAVVKAIKAKYPKADLIEAEEEKEDDETEYAVKIKDGETSLELTVSAEGEIEGIEREIPVSDLPNSISEFIQQKYPQAAIKKVEAEFEIEKGQEELECYEVTVETTDQKTIELKFDSKGKFLEEGKTGDKTSEIWANDFSAEKPDLVSTGRNPYFILEPGYQLVLEDGDEVLTITVLNETKLVDGVETRIIEERETKKGKLVEVSRNYFAISKRTNSVYYFGEDVDMYKDGKIENHKGSWLSGVNNARFGLMMPGKPLVDEKYQQEVAAGVAMDRAEIESLSESVSVPAGEFKNCLVIEETTPLEPDNKDIKKYAANVGLIVDGDLKLVRFGKVDLKK